MKVAIQDFDPVLAVARLGSFRAAALELGMSSSALSHAVSALERRVGVRLLNRTTRSVSTTDAGARFIAQIEPALRDIAAAVESINEQRDTPSGTLRINTSLWAARIILTPIVTEYVRRYPNMTLVLVTEEEMVDVVSKGCDAGIRLADDVPKDMIAVPIGGPVTMMVAGSPKYFERHPKPLSLSDLQKHQCVRGRMKSGEIYKWEFHRKKQKLEIAVPGSLVLDEMSLMIEAALDGAGLIYLDESLLRSDLGDGKLIAVLNDWWPSYPGFNLYYPGRRHVPVGLKALISLIREYNSEVN